MPVKRDLRNNGLGFLQWVESSALYGTEYSDRVFVDGRIKNKDCLVYHNSSYIVMTFCNESYRGVCAYNKLDQIGTDLCPDDDYGSMCRQSDFGLDSKCFCVSYSNNKELNLLKVEFQKIYQNTIYNLLTSDDCSIGLERNHTGTYIWSNTKQEINYTFWSEDVIFDYSHIYGAATLKGWKLTNETLPCFLYEKNLQLDQPTLNLSFNNEENNLILEVTNPKSLIYFDKISLIQVYCFTDASSYNLVYRYANLEMVVEENKNIYRFGLHQHGPGNYWCESFKYFDSKPVQSQTVFVKPKQFGFEFIAILKVEYVRGTNPLSEGIIEILERIFFIKLGVENNESRYISRVMKILDLDEENYQVTVNIHFTYINSSSLTEEEEFNSVKSKIAEASQGLGFRIEMVDFLSASYCLPEKIWPKTKIGNFTTGVFCFNSDGLVVERFCGGNFIDGASWDPVEECEEGSISSVTKLLLHLLFDGLDFNVIEDILLKFEEFTDFDIYLIVLLVRETLNQIKVEIFVEIVDTILEVDRSVLNEAQHKMRALDMLLDVIDKAALITDLVSKKNNFLTITVNSKNLSGVVLNKDHSVTIIDGSFDKIIDFESAIQVSSKSTTIFKFYFTNKFFIGPGSNYVGVLYPDGHKNNFVRIFHPSIKTPEDCAYWKYQLTSKNGRGFWEKIGRSEIISDLTYCDFLQNETSILTFIPSGNFPQNVSEDLETILQSNDSDSEIISKLLNITERFGEFSSYDVYLVGEILKRISDNSEIVLQDLVQIVSNLHKIERPILSQSQSKSLSTDTILHSVDTILKNHNYSSSIRATSENFFVLISDLRETNFSGLLLLPSNTTLETQDLIGDINITEVLGLDNFDSAVILSPGLKNQMLEDTKVVVTIFSSDGLFNQDATKPKSVSKIFGVILPDVGKFQEPVVVFHKISSGQNKRQCAHWLYNYTRSISGTWMKDNEGVSLSQGSQCEFWHTTHFALLLLDEDKYDYELLDWITTVNCALSGLGLISIILTAVFFKRWRANTGNQILLNFVFALILQIGVFYVSNFINQNSHDDFLCTVIGIILHYSVVSQFCWMFVIAILQFKRFVEVLGGPPKYVLLKGCLCGWLLPCLPVASVYFLDQKNYVSGHVGLCYPSGLGLYLGIWLPILIVVIINLVIFLYIIYSVVHRKTECSDVGNSETMFQWRLAILLFFMLGLTWGFGFLSELDDFGNVFVYLFCIFATLQGFIMFLFFIVFNASTRYLYTNAVKKSCNKKSY